jgi:hypothetical protein
MDRETIALTGRGLGRLRRVDSALAGRVTNAEGARSIGVSVRQSIRLRARVAKEGPLGVIHKGRGKTSNRSLPEDERERIKALLATTYAGFNDTHAAEMLRGEGVTECRETLVVAIAVGISAMLSFECGILLDSIRSHSRQFYELALTAISDRDARESRVGRP